MYDIYILAHQFGISPIYVEAISPSDREVLLFYVRREMKEMEEQQRNMNLAMPT